MRQAVAAVLLIAGIAVLWRRAQAQEVPAADDYFDYSSFELGFIGDSMTDPRGIRNNNPGNIEYNGTDWQGLASPASDGRYCIFVDEKWGIRAMARVLTTYNKKYGLNTVRGIIERWAPSFENDTSAYIAHVANWLGVTEDQPYDVIKYLVPLVEVIIQHENGVQPYSISQIKEGVALA